MEFVYVYEYGEYIGKLAGDVETVANLLATADPRNEFSINDGIRNFPILLTMGTMIYDQFDQEWFDEFRPVFMDKLTGESEVKPVEFIEKVRDTDYLEIPEEEM